MLRFLQTLAALLKNDLGSQIVEFAVALPLLVVFVVGIFDFGEAFNQKQKLSNVVREGARFASTLPTNDLDNVGTPPSVLAIRDVVDSYLTANRMNDCGLNGSTGTPNAATLTWTFTVSGNGCPTAMVLMIERAYAFPTVIGANTFQVVSSRVTLKYPFRWHFNKVITTLVPGASYQGITQITTDAVVPNMN